MPDASACVPSARPTKTRRATCSGKSSRKADGREVFTSFAAETATIIPAGAYAVTLTLGAAKVMRDVEVEAGDTTAVAIVAGVGRLQASIVLAPGLAAREPFIEIFAGSEPRPGEAAVAYTYGSAPVFDLAQGVYRARVRTDAVDRTFRFEVKAGQTVSADFALDAGTAAFDAPGAEALVVVAADGRYVTTFYPPFPVFALPAGKYMAVAEKGEAKKETPFEVAAGQRLRVTAAVP